MTKTNTHHKKCLRRAKVRREIGLLPHKRQKKKEYAIAFRNYFVKTGFLSNPQHPYKDSDF